jgi:hypothetical protein
MASSSSGTCKVQGKKRKKRQEFDKNPMEGRRS